MCVAVKNLLLVLPVVVASPVSPTRVGSAWGAGGSLVIRSAVAGATSGWLRGLRTKEGAASSSSSSSAIRTSRRRFGAWLLSAGSASAGDGSIANGLFPLPCPRWSGRDGSDLPRCWCIEHTEQRRPLAGPPPQDSPYQVPVTRTLRTDQRLQSAVEPKTCQELGGQVLKKQY